MANTKITNPELFNLGDSTSATQLPVMTTTQRIAMNAPPTLNIDYLVVAGGGGGASGYGASGAGGGAGEFLYKTAQTLTLGGSGYTVTVGAGGIGGQVTNSTVGSAGAQGGDSVFIQTTKGGGFGRPAGGSPAGVYVGSDGGSGGGGTFNGAGGASIATSPGLGFAGGAGFSTTNYGSGGGGGAGSAGINGTSTSGGNGGAGVQNSITGVSPAPYYAAGGGAGLFDRTSVTGIGGSGIGGSSYYNQNATDGAANTGSGGGGACNYLGNVYQGGDGGSGVIILRYTTADVASYTATGLTPTETTVGTDTILSFTTVGTGTITFTSSTPTGTISTGEIIFNSTTDKVEYWDGTKWYGITYEVTAESPYNNVLYTGNGSARSITGVGFEPDLVWIKKRNSASNSSHMLFDIVRGVDKVIITDSTQAQYDGGGTGYQTSFNTDGFSITGNGFVNQSGNTFVAWCFKAGGAAVANTDGSTASQVSANVAGGFSIVTTAPTAGAITFGHGLDSAPEMIINKGYTSNGWSWLVYHKDIGTGKYLTLNSTASTTNFAGSFSNVTSTTITNASSTSSQTYVNYCFHSVPGYSKVGSYTGNGNNTGPVVSTGFEPSFILIKASSRTGYWIMLDNKRNTSNPRDNPLYSNTSWAEDINQINRVNFDATGFQVVGTGGDVNASGHTYTYMTFA